MTLRMYCVADCVNYHWDPDDPLAMVDYHPNADPGFDTIPQLAAPDVVEEDAPLMAWWRQRAAEGGSRHA